MNSTSPNAQTPRQIRGTIVRMSKTAIAALVLVGAGLTLTVAPAEAGTPGQAVECHVRETTRWHVGEGTKFRATHRRQTTRWHLRCEDGTRMTMIVDHGPWLPIPPRHLGSPRRGELR